MSWISEETYSKSQYFIYPSQLSSNPDSHYQHYQFEYQYESQLSFMTCSCDELTNEDLYDSMQVIDSNSSYTSDDFSFYSNNEVSSEKYSTNDAILSQQFEGQNQCEIKENKCTFSMPMTFRKDSIPKSLLSTPRLLYNKNYQLDTFLDDISKVPMTSQSINEPKNIELRSIRNCNDDNELKSSDLYKKSQTFRGWIKNFTKINY